MKAVLSILILSVASTTASADEKSLTFIEAARTGDLKTVQKMIKEGIDVDVRPKFEITALWQATGKGHIEIIKALLEAGANPNINDNTWKVTPLMLSEKPEIVSLLLKNGANGAATKLRNSAIRGQLEDGANSTRLDKN